MIFITNSILTRTSSYHRSNDLLSVQFHHILRCIGHPCYCVVWHSVSFVSYESPTITLFNNEQRVTTKKVVKLNRMVTNLHFLELDLFILTNHPQVLVQAVIAGMHRLHRLHGLRRLCRLCRRGRRQRRRRARTSHRPSQGHRDNPPVHKSHAFLGILHAGIEIPRVCSTFSHHRSPRPGFEQERMGPLERREWIPTRPALQRPVRHTNGSVPGKEIVTHGQSCNR